MPLSPSEVERLVLAKFKEASADGLEGPHRMGEYEIIRVWTKDRRGFYHAHYAAVKGDKVEIFQDFSPFANWLSRTFDLDGASTRDLASVPMVVAALVVLFAMVLVGYIVIRNPTGSFPLVYVLTAVVGGGAGFLFGTKGRFSKSPPSSAGE